MGNKVCLYGASGHAKVVAEVFRSQDVIITAVVDDNPKTDVLLSIPVYNSKKFFFSEQTEWLIGIGNNKTRKRIVEKLALTYISAFHAKAVVSPSSMIGWGTVVMAGTVINAEVSIGNHCIINTNATIEHDCQLADYVHISPNAALAGNVIVGEGTHIGIGASIIQGVVIGKWATIGAGSVIIKDVPDYATVVGNPGKIIKMSTHE